MFLFGILLCWQKPVRFTISYITYYYLKWFVVDNNNYYYRRFELFSSIIELVKEKKSCSFVLPNSDPRIHKDIRAKLSVWSGLKWGKFLFHKRHWTDIISSDIWKHFTIFKNYFTCCANTCNKVANAIKQCSIHFLSVELWIRRYNEGKKFSVTPSLALTHPSEST